MKILLLGLSGSGKSTLAQLLGKTYKLNVYEADDEVMLINKNKWPTEDSIVDKGFAQANEKALKLDTIIFVTTWLSKADFHRFVTHGYLVVELHADFEILVKRKVARDNPPQEHIDKYKSTYDEFVEYISDPTISKNILVGIDTTNLHPEGIVETISHYL